VATHKLPPRAPHSSRHFSAELARVGL